MKRRFVQISSDGNYVWAIADDGTAWHKPFTGEPWQPIEPLPDIELDKLPRYRLDDDEQAR